MENIFFSLALIKGQGINGSPIGPDVRLPMIATKDIAHVAAQRLVKGDFKGHSVLELHGQRDLTLRELTLILGRAIKKPNLPYIQFPYADAYKAMVGMGLSPDLANVFNEMYKAFNDGIIKPTQPRSPATTTPTSIEEFSEVFARVFNHA